MKVNFKLETRENPKEKTGETFSNVFDRTESLGRDQPKRPRPSQRATHLLRYTLSHSQWREVHFSICRSGRDMHRMHPDNA